MDLRARTARLRTWTYFIRPLVFATTLLTATACDRNDPLPPVAATPAPLASSAPSSLPTVAPQARLVAPAEVGMSGEVRERNSNVPLVGAIVVVSSRLYATDTPPASIPDGAVAKTAADGTFHLANIADGTYPIEVFAPGHITIHQQLVVHGQHALAPFFVSSMTPEERNWIRQINRDRSVWGAPPLVADEAVMQAARLRARTMGQNGVFSHECIPGQKDCMNGPQAELALGAFQAGGENIGAQNEGTWRDVESGMLAEWEHCDPVAHRPHADACNFTEDTGHFLNIVNRTYRFVGVAAHHKGRSFDVSYGPSTDYYAMEFE